MDRALHNVMLKDGFDARSVIRASFSAAQDKLSARSTLSVELARDKLPGFLFRGLDLLCGNAAQIPSQPEFRKGPNDPLGRIDLPWFYSVAVVMLKLMVIVVIAFAESEEGQEKRIARAASG